MFSKTSKRKVKAFKLQLLAKLREKATALNLDPQKVKEFDVYTDAKHHDGRVIAVSKSLFSTITLVLEETDFSSGDRYLNASFDEEFYNLSQAWQFDCLIEAVVRKVLGLKDKEV